MRNPHTKHTKVPPNIIDMESTPSSVAVRENQSINMTCRAEGFPTPKIIWRREDGQSITVERKKKVMVYDGDILHLSKLSRNEVSWDDEESKGEIEFQTEIFAPLQRQVTRH